MTGRIVLQKTVLVIAVMMMVSCSGPKPDSAATGKLEKVSDAALLVSTPLAAAAGEGGFTLMSPETTGVNFTNLLKREHHVPFVNTGAGVALGDVDNDGLTDIYLLSTDGPNALYRQVSPFVFEDVTASAGVDGGQAWSRGASFADVNDDGHLDLYVCHTEAPNLLYLNRGDGTFEEAGKRLGLDHSAASIMSYFADYDGDGDLDMYLVTYQALHPVLTDGQILDIKPPADTTKSLDEMAIGRPRYDMVGDKKVSRNKEEWINLGTNQEWELGGQIDRLFRNDNGVFTDVTEAAGLLDYGLGLSATWMDFDDDGRLDIYVANDLTTRDKLWRNNGDGTFSNILTDVMPHTTWYSMGSDFADINGDGRFDLMVADMAATTHYRAKVDMGAMGDSRWFLMNEWPRQKMQNSLFLNTGAGRFMEVSALTGLAATDWTWAIKFGDLDNDGRIDLFAANGTSRNDMNPDLLGIKYAEILQAQGEIAAKEYLKTIPTAPNHNLAYRNAGDFKFEKVSPEWGLDHLGISFGAAYADFDRDGDLDLVVNNLEEPASVYRNDGTAGSRILVKLVGSDSNHFGYGAVVTVRSETTGLQRRQLLPARGFMSSDEPLLHFGLGSDQTVDSLEITWPNGRLQRYEGLATGQLYTVTEPGASGLKSTDTPVVAQYAALPASTGLDFTHVEIFHDDFVDQKLLPAQLSQLGPGLAWGDVDGDGDDDLFVAGGFRQSGRLLLNQGNGVFKRHKGGPWEAHMKREDMAPLWFDVDSDGDLDLLVTSGSVQGKGKDLADRLYLNDGHGGFSNAGADMLPADEISSGVAAAADFDRDGDLDLFVGGRTNPGAYPTAPQSRLLRNDGGKLVDVTDKIAPGLSRAGMVTGALWSDSNSDGQLDLLLTLEWGPVMVFINQDGGLVDGTAEAGLSELTGWWNSLTGGDFNGDGHMDYAVLNNGLNSKYKASVDKPAELFYGDMDGSGKPELIEAKHGKDAMLPVRGRSCSSDAMPVLGDKFPTFHDFASASLDQIYDPMTLSNSLHMTATTLESGVLLNDGKGGFSFKPLPRLAQAAPGFGAHATDFNGDGLLDLYFVQNFFTREPETGLLDGGVSAMLHGDGQGGFEWASPAETGLVVWGDAKGLAVTDLNRDGLPDPVVTRNGGRMTAYENRGNAGKSLSVRLRGAGSAVIGARVTAVYADGHKLVAETYAGSGYLSQSAPVVFFGGADDIKEVTIHWADGEISSVEPGEKRAITAQHPSNQRG